MLGELFRERATGALPFFVSLSVTLPRHLEQAAADALSGDRVLSSRYRLAGPGRRKLISG